MTEATSAKPWLATYGDSIPAEIDANAYTSVVDMLEQAMRRYADRIAFCSFSNAITDHLCPARRSMPGSPAAYSFADALARGASLAFKPVELNGDDLLFLQYTGGTTGLSKGATLLHRNLIAKH